MKENKSFSIMYKSHSKNVDEIEAYQRMNATDIFFQKVGSIVIICFDSNSN